MEKIKRFFKNKNVQWIISTILFLISLFIFTFVLCNIYKSKNKEINPKTDEDGETTSIIISGTTYINENGDTIATIIDEETGEEVTVIIDSDTGEVLKTTTNPETGEVVTKVITTKPTTTKPSIKVDATYNSVDEMKKSNIGDGKIVLTKGYYSSNDGGGAYYNIVKTTNYSEDNGRVVKLNNGLFAVLKNSEESIMSVKQYGVKGDGSSNDINQMNAIVKAGYKTLYFPNGTYNMNEYFCKPNRYVEIVGDGKQKTIIKNFSIENRYGIKLENATFEGGKKFDFSSAGGTVIGSQIILVRVFLNDDNNSITFNNCVFKDMDIVSDLSTSLATSLKFDHVTNCDFKNIRRACIYHSANIGESIYTDNTFTDIGSKSINRYFVTCIWLGDVTNVTYTESKNVIIKNNKFNHFMSADDPSMAKHVINGNIIAIRANKAIIDNNYINNVDGIGEDREAVYSKVKYLTVTNNTIINGGFGEGYITCKNQDGQDAFATITGNNISGDYGVGIYNYGAGLIKNNTINIKHSRGGIACHYREVTGKSITIEENSINLGAGTYQYNGSGISGYGPSNIIVVSGPRGDTFIKNNRINLTQTGEVFPVGIDISALKDNATITGNVIEGANALTTGVMVHANNTTSEDCKDSVVNVSNNSIKGINGTGVSFFFNDSSGVVSTRRYEISNNTVYTPNNYGVQIQASSSSNDTLVYSAPIEDSANKNKARAVNVKNVTDPNGLVTSV